MMWLNDSYVVFTVLRSVLDMIPLHSFTHTFGENPIYFLDKSYLPIVKTLLKTTECQHGKNV